MKIVATSDLHGDLPDPRSLPKGDVLVLAGDLFPDDYQPHDRGKIIGSTRIIRQGFWFEEVFIPWLLDVKNIRPTDKGADWEKRYKSIIFIGGNHDFFLNAMLPSGINKRLPRNIHYLSESVVEVNGVKFFGAGWNCTRGWAFCLDEEDHEIRLREKVPADTDVMIVHGPPTVEGMDDYHYTSMMLTYWVKQQKNIKAFISGHIHEGYGSYMMNHTPVHVVSRKDRQYRDVNDFVIIDI